MFVDQEGVGLKLVVDAYFALVMRYFLFETLLLFFRFLVVSLYFHHLLSNLSNQVHLASLEILVLKVHVISLFGQLVDFAEFVHVELANEGS